MVADYQRDYERMRTWEHMVALHWSVPGSGALTFIAFLRRGMRRQSRARARMWPQWLVDARDALEARL